uniref:Putative secreted protein n=1 Tax=Ixodes ricinus TaxID=34613 RepID=A0A6B0UXY8_IXORI
MPGVFHAFSGFSSIAWLITHGVFSAGRLAFPLCLKIGECESAAGGRNACVGEVTQMPRCYYCSLSAARSVWSWHSAELINRTGFLAYFFSVEDILSASLAANISWQALLHVYVESKLECAPAAITWFRWSIVAHIIKNVVITKAFCKNCHSHCETQAPKYCLHSGCR